MRLKPSTLTDLRRQVGSLQDERKELLTRITLIDGDLKAAQLLLKSTVTEKLETRADWIRHSVKALDCPSNAKEVAAEMIKGGFQTNDPENLWKNVAVELNRMGGTDDDPVTRVERGKYRFNGEP